MWRIIGAVLLTFCLPSGCAAAAKRQAGEQQQAQAATASKADFCWPLAEFRYSLNRPTGAWLAPRGRNSHHLGVDMFAPVGRPVRAIADGVVHDISTSGWGGGNVAVMLKHQLADGRWFIALYGHIRNIYGLRKGSKVQGCGAVGVIGPYRCGSHVHFGVIAPGRLPHAPYGTSKRGDHNNFINPVRFLQTGKPEAPGKDEEPPPAAEEDSAMVSPQCADMNLAEGSPEEDQLLDSAPKSGRELLAEKKKEPPRKKDKAAAQKTGSKKKAAVTKSAAKHKAVPVKKAAASKKTTSRSAKKSSSKKTPVLKGGSKRSVSPRKRR